REEADRLKQERRNDPQFQDTINFLDAAAQALDQIADLIRAARETGSPEEKNQLFSKAEAVARGLADLVREYAARNHDRLVDFGGNMSVPALATLLFSLIGVSPDVALPVVRATLGLAAAKK